MTDRPRASKLSLTALLIPVAGWLATLPVVGVLMYVGATGAPLRDWQLTVVGLGYLGTLAMAALARIAADEAGHVALSADILAWCLQMGGPSVREAVEGARLPRAPVAPSRPIAGGLPPARRRALHAEAVATARTWQRSAEQAA